MCPSKVSSNTVGHEHWWAKSRLKWTRTLYLMYHPIKCIFVYVGMTMSYINVVGIQQEHMQTTFDWLIANQMPILYYNMPNHNILWMQPIYVRSDGFQYFKMNSFKYTCITNDYHTSLRLFCACVSKIRRNLICWWSISMYIACKDYPVTCEPWKRPISTVSRQTWTRQLINSFRTVHL